MIHARWHEATSVVRGGLLGILAVLCSLGPTLASAQQYFFEGGEVVSSPRVVAVYWGNQAPGLQANQDRFYAQILGSSYLDWLSDYSTPQRPIGRGSFAGGFQIRQGDAGGIDTVGIARVIDGEILAGRLPAPGADTIYMVHFGPTMAPAMGTIILGNVIGANVGAGFCAYHYTARTQVPITPPVWYAYGPKLRIAVIPTVTGVPGCASSGAFDDATSLASHELMETITDPDAVVLGMFPVAGETLECNGVSMPPGIAVANAAWGWVSASSGFCNPDEIADDNQAGRFRTSPTATDSFLVTRAWRNRANANVLSAPMGHLDGANAGYDGLIRGWALDQDAAGPINVTIVIDGTTSFTVSANQPRPDVTAATGIAGDHGFQLAIPASFLDGRAHGVAVVARGIVPGNDTMLSTVGQVFTSPQTASQVCLGDCAADRAACMADAHNGPARGVCVKTYNACVAHCP